MAGALLCNPKPLATASAKRLLAMADHPMPASDLPALKTVNVRIKGKVQGVYYRNWTVETAQQLGLNGWVRNRRDGSVEAVFSGKPAEVDSMIEKCRTGPSAAVVTGLDAKSVSETVPQGFERRPTE